MRIGFYQPEGRNRSPIYTTAGVKAGYIEIRADGTWYTRCDGTLVGRITKHNRELPEVSTSCSCSHQIEVEKIWENLG